MGGERGYDGGKRVKGRKRHIVVDSLGLPLAVSVTAANVHDLRGGRRALNMTKEFLCGRSLRKLYADGGYISGEFRSYVKRTFQAVVEVSKSLAQKFKRFIPASQRWVVERSLSWMYDCRRLTIDYERHRPTQPIHDAICGDRPDAKAAGTEFNVASMVKNRTRSMARDWDIMSAWNKKRESLLGLLFLSRGLP